MWEALSSALPSIIGFVAVGVVAALSWGIRKLSLKKELEEAINAFTQRTIDKAESRLKIALMPESDGGVRVTSQELSEIRQAVWDSLKSELKGPLASLLLKWGEERIKGIIGTVLKKQGVDRATESIVEPSI